MGEGMPWNIIMIFFIIGVIMGVKSGGKDLEQREKDLAEAPDGRKAS